MKSAMQIIAVFALAFLLPSLASHNIPALI